MMRLIYLIVLFLLIFCFYKIAHFIVNKFHFNRWLFRAGLGAVEVPLLLATSPQDHTVPASDSDIVAAGVSGPVERLPLPRSYHLAPLDHDAELLFERSAAFLDRHVPAPGRPT